ncbi:MAG: SIS domain-containing protein, partial [Nitrososphaerales archaeon]
MLTPDEIRSIDKSSICSAYDKWPEYCKNAFTRNIDVDEKLFANVSSIVFSGMGGSGTTGDILADWMRLKCKIPIHVAKNYHIPAFVDDKTLFIALSVSGGTEETLTALVEAASAGAKIIAVSQGDEMEQICKRKKLFHLKIQQRILPRVTLPEVVYSVLNLLARSTFLDGLKDQIQNSIQSMEEVKDK